MEISLGRTIHAADDGRNHGAQNDRSDHRNQRATPAAADQQARRDDASGDFDPLQRQDNILIHVIDADHETAVFFEQQTIARQEKSSGQGKQEHGAQSTQEVALECAGQPKLTNIDFLHVLANRQRGQ